MPDPLLRAAGGGAPSTGERPLSGGAGGGAAVRREAENLAVIVMVCVGRRQVKAALRKARTGTGLHATHTLHAAAENR
ncbi:hypothetical protein E2C01_059485 [Portunus trituberculatus]|uniref:Uncharacterized protein n=1 Tax=Portunus trituberculatus TaxID=210409 RepID=A0A5B7GYB2_PORTR|nr:hypothetical protein [Portunus trituberculatus]